MPDKIVVLIEVTLRGEGIGVISHIFDIDLRIRREKFAFYCL